MGTYGAAVEALVAKPHLPPLADEARIHRGGWRREQDGAVSLTRCPIYVPAQPSALKWVIHLASFMVSALMPALRAALRHNSRPDLVITIAPAHRADARGQHGCAARAVG